MSELKKRSGVAKALEKREFQQKIVASKKGKGSYSRKKFKDFLKEEPQENNQSAAPVKNKVIAPKKPKFPEVEGPIQDPQPPPEPKFNPDAPAQDEIDLNGPKTKVDLNPKLNTQDPSTQWPTVKEAVIAKIRARLNRKRVVVNKHKFVRPEHELKQPAKKVLANAQAGKVGNTNEGEVIDKSNEFREKQLTNRYARLKGQATSHKATVIKTKVDRDKDKLARVNEMTKHKLAAYVKKAHADVLKRKEQYHAVPKDARKNHDKMINRGKGIHKAVDKMTEEMLHLHVTYKKGPFGSQQELTKHIKVPVKGQLKDKSGVNFAKTQLKLHPDHHEMIKGGWQTHKIEAHTEDTDMASTTRDLIKIIMEKKRTEMNPDELMRSHQTQAEGENWHQNHPVHHMNIVNHYNQATDEEKRVGHNWYADAHHITKAIAHDTNTPMHHAAGLVANYSPQTHWFQNIHTAAHVMRHKTPVGGPGSGVFASNDQKRAAGRIMSGENYNNVLKGHKIKAFAHLIEHGGDHPDDKVKHVVVDRHAHSVASGARITDAAFSVAGLKGKKKYDQVSQSYRDAAAHLSKQHGVEIHPHQVQAVTWLTRQRLNANEEKAASKTGVSKTHKRSMEVKKKWDDYAKEHHPSVMGHEPGVGYTEETEYSEE